MEARAFLLREIEEDTARRLAEITQRQKDGMLRIKQEKEEEEKNAALRLLDSLEKDILTLDACKHAQRRVQGYGDFCRGACAGGIGEITLGYAKCGASDADSMLKTILSGIFGSAYDAGCVKVPFVLGKAAQKPLLIKYSPRESDEMYALLANYAAQYLFCFADAGVKVNICGAGEPFAALAGDSRVNIVSDSSAVSRLISSLAEGAFDRDTVQALFISDVSMVRGSLARQALSDILRRAADCGVHVFMGAQTYDALAESETCLCDTAELCGSVLNMEAGGALCLPEPIDSSVIARICAADAVCGVRFDSAAFFENDGFLLGTAGAEHLTVPRQST
jgi:hypothetical protein